MVAVITKWTHERVARVAELIDRGLTYNEIGERMGERISGTAKAGDGPVGGSPSTVSQGSTRRFDLLCSTSPPVRQIGRSDEMSSTASR